MQTAMNALNGVLSNTEILQIRIQEELQKLAKRPNFKDINIPVNTRLIHIDEKRFLLAVAFLVIKTK